ncbi:HAD-IC family P-type ATPase [Nevskia soli]|uniref:HAD-IC family P-type ATPase n=1 Tax=Nevskia soli TaxID=418856 RepID=UPI00056CFF3F|nr:HAD-IC family P-type ATPase [Nevskia soli]
MDSSGAKLPAVGLTSEEALRRRAQHGPNTVAEERESHFRRFVRHCWAPVPWMLEATVLLQLVLGEYVEAALIAGLLAFNIALGVFQEGRANAALNLLKQRLAPRARVRRDNCWRELPAVELVPGDVVQLSLGTLIPADVQLLSGSVLLDQSMLTGESVPVDAAAGSVGYAGALVRRGEAIALVTATGSATYFGRAAELVRIAHIESAEFKAVLGLVRNLSIINGAVVIGLVAYAQLIGLPAAQIILLVLTAMISAVPVALPATFTLGAALGARALAQKGVLLTRLSALHEAAAIDLLCADKTGTLTSNELAVATVRPLAAGWSVGDILAFATLASSPDGDDPVDAAIRRAAAATPGQRKLPHVVSFTPFDPASKRAEGLAQDADGTNIRIAKGAPSAVEDLVRWSPAAKGQVAALAGDGYRTLAVVAGPQEHPELLGLVALNDPPRADSAALIAGLHAMGVQTVMVTGDAAATAATVGRAIGLEGRVCPREQIPDRVTPDEFAIFAGVFPEDKFRLVRAFQRGGHAVGMCGDGANDAPALRQAQMGIAVSTATDVAKAAAGIVLTTPGLGGIVTAIREGRTVFQRILTYTLTILVNKCVTLIVLGGGLILTGHAVLTPMLQALMMFAGDFVSMARTADRATPSLHPNSWRLPSLIRAAIPLAVCKLVFCFSVLAMGAFRLGLGVGQMQTLTVAMLVYAGQGMNYLLRERGHLWDSRPSALMMLFSLGDIMLISTFAACGVLMAALPVRLLLGLFAATVAFLLLTDQIKVVLFRRRRID